MLLFLSRRAHLLTTLTGGGIAYGNRAFCEAHTMAIATVCTSNTIALDGGNDIFVSENLSPTALSLNGRP